ncbi:MAG: site-2 protease family protein [Anaerolineales bacterium]|nr:putative zinc metalloprotease Rip3 [Anaerolineales bacterium]MCZ7549612.1 site-2 protease family protein [Anaerolineales bacterium]MDX9936426.1 site-2 protease family protein [Anaerolineales bacterium]WKZ49903.1 MAG: site-2 protease family protein [Anaerolineales bacterium]GER80248.1 zinc metalloprotease M50B [Candidatus Denitrolinea symbiosum]
MSWSLKLFKVKDIDIKVHMTFVLILIWAAYRWSLSTGEGIQGAVFGVAATLLLFLSVTLHELGHSLQAIKFGVRVKDITLMPMGGLARLDEIPEEPNKELRIALAGPLVNFAIAALLVGVGALLDARALISLDELQASLGSVSWSGLLAYLTSANLLLGLFNLIPAFPMDGGRVLRALLAKKMNHVKATQVAAQVGQGLAFLMGLWGFISGSWTLVIIAVFVWMGAGQENQGAQVKHTLGDATVGQAMTRSPHTLRVNDSLSKAVELTLTTSQADFPVLEWGSNRVVGLIGEVDLLRGLQSLGANGAAREIMRTKIAVASPGESLHAAQQKMLTNRTRALLVLNPDGELMGLLTADDVNEAYRLLTVNPQLAASAQ